jgi:hypothetical protein
MAATAAALGGYIGSATAQNPVAVQQGTAFAKSVAPTSASQVVNPAGVNSGAWGANTATPTAVAPGLGSFSNPDTSNAPYMSASVLGLSGYGNQSVVNCANFVPDPGSDPLQVQSCAAVNFMTNNCLSPTTSQLQIITANGGSHSVSGNCAGTYGQSQAAYGFAGQINGNDAVFSVMTGLPAAVPGETGQSCSVQTVILTPAQYEQDTCAKNNLTGSYTCTQTMTAAVTTLTTPPIASPTCDGGVAQQSGTLPNGYSGPYCEYDSGQYQADQGYPLGCAQLFSFPDQTFEYEHDYFECPEGGCVAEDWCYYAPSQTCPAGYAPQGTQCVMKTLTKSFSDDCGPYTQSAGITLPKP